MIMGRFDYSKPSFMVVVLLYDNGADRKAIRALNCFSLIILVLYLGLGK